MLAVKSVEPFVFNRSFSRFWTPTDFVLPFISDISNGAQNSKTLEGIRALLNSYDTACVIVERDRVKGTGMSSMPTL